MPGAVGPSVACQVLEFVERLGCPEQVAGEHRASERGDGSFHGYGGLESGGAHPLIPLCQPIQGLVAPGGQPVAARELEGAQHVRAPVVERDALDLDEAVTGDDGLRVPWILPPSDDLLCPGLRILFGRDVGGDLGGEVLRAGWDRLNQGHPVVDPRGEGRRRVLGGGGHLGARGGGRCGGLGERGRGGRSGRGRRGGGGCDTSDGGRC